ncbi:glycosyltransferase [Bradyrhizobium jicamae]|uniref:glycosyltransferase n=1 Tax=Bradyrhizobium jicamae TaxID=280332 RepID=UPI001BAA49ED|nr:glycosyltransferase [Bradyrhizobium jicamae]
MNSWVVEKIRNPFVLSDRSVRRRWRFFEVARAVQIGPLMIGRATNLDALSKGAFLETAERVGQPDNIPPIVKLGPIAIMRARGFGKIARRLRKFKLEIDDFRAMGNGADLAQRKSSGRNRDRRSVVFLHNCYYNFFYLAAALRKRGWDAVSVSIEDPHGPHANFYHGEDINLYDSNPELYRRKLFDFFAETEDRFRMLHFYGVRAMSMFPATMRRGGFYGLPIDFLRLRQLGIKIGYTVAGCLDGVAQSSIKSWSGACDKCVWQLRPEICSDAGNLEWGRQVHTICDVVDTGGSPTLDWKGKADKVFRDPLTMALEPELWRPDLQVPEKYQLKRSPGELIVYHAVGNYELRSQNDRNIKGTGAILAAVDRLKNEGVHVRLEFVTNIPSKDVRFIQVQADVVVDQLNYGRYGAQAAEAMMLGRPTICYIKKDELPGVSRIGFVEDCPIVTATEESIYEVLKDLLADENRRRELQKASREFALKWHSADACALRFELLYDRLMRGLPPTDGRWRSDVAKPRAGVANHQSTTQYLSSLEIET